MENYVDHFLIATSKMPDSRFARTVIYICSHSLEEGAMGFVVNHYIPEITLAIVFNELNIDLPEKKLPRIFLGGPVDAQSAYILHSAEYQSENSMEINHSITLSRDPVILNDISTGRGPQDYLFLLGYSGWGPGQLEAELVRDGWLMLPADYEDLFRIDPDSKWQKITKKYGIDIALFEDVAGMA